MKADKIEERMMKMKEKRVEALGNEMNNKYETK